MRIPQSGLRIDNPAYPLLQAHLAYAGTTSGAGNALGTTFVAADLDNFPTYVGNQVKMIGGGADGQDRMIMAHAAGGIITVDAAFTNAAGAAQQILASQLFTILTRSGGGGGGAGMPPTAALWMFGVVSPAQVGSTTIIDIPHLAGFQDDTFNNEFYLEILNAGAAAPEGQKRLITNYVGATGRFTTDTFGATVDAGDIVAIYHTAIAAINIAGRGVLDTDSVTVPADSTRTAAYPWENNDYFKGCMLLPTEGNCRYQPRPIRSYASATGVFTLDEPFSQLPGAVDYLIIRSDYPVQRLLDIFTLVNAILVTTETGGTLTTTGAVQDVYINNAPPPIILT